MASVIAAVVIVMALAPLAVAPFVVPLVALAPGTPLAPVAVASVAAVWLPWRSGPVLTGRPFQAALIIHWPALEQVVNLDTMTRLY